MLNGNPNLHDKLNNQNKPFYWKMKKKKNRSNQSTEIGNIHTLSLVQGYHLTVTFYILQYTNEQQYFHMKPTAPYAHNNNTNNKNLIKSIAKHQNNQL